MDATVDELFGKLKRLKAFDFFKTRALTPEQRGWLKFICERYANAMPLVQESIRLLVTPESSFLLFMYAVDMALEAVRT